MAGPGTAQQAGRARGRRAEEQPGAQGCEPAALPAPALSAALAAGTREPAGSAVLVTWPAGSLAVAGAAGEVPGCGSRVTCPARLA